MSVDDLFPDAHCRLLICGYHPVSVGIDIAVARHLPSKSRLMRMTLSKNGVTEQYHFCRNRNRLLVLAVEHGPQSLFVRYEDSIRRVLHGQQEYRAFLPILPHVRLLSLLGPDSPVN